MKTLNTTLLYFLITIHSLSFAQSSNPLPKWALTTYLGHQEDGINIPVGTLKTIHDISIRPDVKIGIERSWKQYKRTRFTQDIHIGYFHDTYVEKVFVVGSKLGLEVKLWNNFFLTPRLGVAYNHAQPNDVRYQYLEGKWENVSNNDPNVNRAYVSTELMLGYRINNLCDIGMSTHYALLIPHIPDLGSPFNLAKGYGLNLRYFLQNQ
jgi:hypothetical protein